MRRKLVMAVLFTAFTLMGCSGKEEKTTPLNEAPTEETTTEEPTTDEEVVIADKYDRNKEYSFRVIKSEGGQGMIDMDYALGMEILDMLEQMTYENQGENNLLGNYLYSVQINCGNENCGSITFYSEDTLEYWGYRFTSNEIGNVFPLIEQAIEEENATKIVKYEPDEEDENIDYTIRVRDNATREVIYEKKSSEGEILKRLKEISFIQENVKNAEGNVIYTMFLEYDKKTVMTLIFRDNNTMQCGEKLYKADEISEIISMFTN